MGVGGAFVGGVAVRVGMGVKVEAAVASGAVAEMGRLLGGFPELPDRLQASVAVKRTTARNR